MKQLLLSFLAIGLLFSCKNQTKEEPEKLPNIVVIYADDLGFGDLSSYGSDRISTPNIDKLVNGGIKFTDGHASAATCTPSRFSLLTGMYAWRNKNARILPGNAPLLISTDQITVPKMMKQKGYVTGIVGKWHLGLGDGNVDWNQHISPSPNEVGFDYSYILAATQDRVPTVYIKNGDVVNLDPSDPIEVSYEKNFPGEPTGKDNPELLTTMYDHGHDMTIVNGISRIGFMKGGHSARWIDEDMVDVFTEEAKGFVKNNADKPFFLYYALQQPHVPRTPNQRFVGKTELGPRGDVIVEADWSVGELIKTLREEGLLENTLIVFSSDNGPVLQDGYVDQAEELAAKFNYKPAGPYRGGKYSLYEGGTRVPFATYWEGKIKPGTSKATVCQMDFLATFAALIGQEVEKTDSENLLDAFLGNSQTGRTNLVEQAMNKTAYRSGNWKMIPPYEGPAVSDHTIIELGNSSEVQLYNLDTDEGEQKNVAAENEEILQKLVAEYQEITGNVLELIE